MSQNRDVPIFINVRDRVRDLRVLVAWLEAAGHERIVLLDNDSTWEPCLDYLAASPHTVIRLLANLGSNALWVSEICPRIGRFVYTDPDVVPIEDCPMDLVQRMHEILDEYPACPKVGPTIHLDDLTLEHTSQLGWERSLVMPYRAIRPGLWSSQIDTTFALYQEGQIEHTLLAARMGYPYEIRHMPWYHEHLDAEDAYYLEHAKRGMGGTTWTGRMPDAE